MFSKTAAGKERPALFFLLKLLILGCLLKCTFFLYNYNLTEGWEITHAGNAWQIVKWSFVYDAFCVAIIAWAFLLLTGVCRKNKATGHALVAVFTLAITFFILLNVLDIFYFRFHLQRADADLLFVLRNPITSATFLVAVILLALLSLVIVVTYHSFRSLRRVQGFAAQGSLFPGTLLALTVFLAIFFITGTKKFLPTYPLTMVKPVQLPLVQNSLHTFAYSLYRRDESMLPRTKYFSSASLDSVITIRKQNAGVSSPKNIVLFIMESVPMEFFDTTSPYKVEMPFLDSLLNKSRFYTNAFSYSYSSNKGITAVLAALPTVTDIPLYHSNYTSIERTSVGALLKKHHYNSSFFIGDNYDDFGFAKCMQWLGIDNYYSMENIPGYKKMARHPMGLHDEYTLSFMGKKISQTKEPFLAIHYNISTHYPNDVPGEFSKKFPAIGGSAQMKSMRYYNECLRSFFSAAADQPWFRNSVFIFCSDHWAQPNKGTIRIDEVSSFRIPIFIYDPSAQKKEIIHAPVSQLDILNTVLHYASFKEPFISYGFNLLDTLRPDRTIFTKTNTAVYQAINERYVLGFDAANGKTLYCYDYKRDPAKKINLLEADDKNIEKLTTEMKAFLQTAAAHYRKGRE